MKIADIVISQKRVEDPVLRKCALLGQEDIKVTQKKMDQNQQGGKRISNCIFYIL